MKRLAGFLTRLNRTGMEQVGRDAYGNVFWSGPDGLREIEFGQSDHGHVDDVVLQHDNDMHPLWYSWLRKQRDEIPTEDEVKRFDLAKMQLAERVKEVELKERKLQLKEQRARFDSFGEDGGTSPGGVVGELGGGDDGWKP